VTKSKLIALLSNGLSVFGGVMAVFTAAVIAFLFGVTVMSENSNPYLGILVYMALPPVLLVGLLLVPIGMYRRWRQMKAGQADANLKWPRADFNDRGTRRVFALVMGGGLVYIAASSIGAYEAYHYTESVEFCGQLCHTVMEPEYTAYQHSPHARVTCVECHVGSGADWFVKSKISGAYQVYAVLANDYPRPIKTPIESLRPAQETCEQCHWPEKFYGAQQKTFNHYFYDEDNTRWTISMLLKTGGGNPRVGETGGIHWHMNIGATVEYIARDDKRMDIPWVRLTDKSTGAVKIFEDEDEPLTEEEKAELPVRTMDCMDCHNRPSHIFYPPDQSLDVALHTGRIDRSLPEVKVAAGDALVPFDGPYETKEQAMEGIATYIADYYQENWPEVMAEKRAAVDTMIQEVQDIYAHTIFPEMGADWSVYPNNIGHFYDKGCMRCHDEDIVAADGQSVSTDCNVCHIIVGQGEGEHEELAASLAGLEFEHPDGDDDWRTQGCWECHLGTYP
jgi:hypothetical protein